MTAWQPLTAALTRWWSATSLAIANSFSNDVSVLLNLGKGTFPTVPSYPVGASPDSAAALDLDGDGKIDLAVASGGSNTVSVLLNQGDGTFAPRIDYIAGEEPSPAAAADLNGDGAADLVVTSYTGGTVTVLLAACLP